MFTSRGLRVTKKIFSFKNLFLILIAALFSMGMNQAQANLPATAFWKNHAAALRFTTSAQSLANGNCSSVVTVGTYNSAGILTNVPSTMTVNLAAASTTFYSDVDCLSAISSVAITTGSSTANFYFIVNAAASQTITASAASYKNAAQTETIAVNAFIWTGNGGSPLWTTGANWSGGAAPGATDAALFDGSCVSNCSPTIASSALVGKIRMTSAYVGTITQADDISVGSSFVQAGGTWNAGSSTLTITGDYTKSGGTFTAGTSTVILKGSSYTNSRLNFGAEPFNNLSIVCDFTRFFLTGTASVSGSLVFGGFISYSDEYLLGGTILASGNVTSSGTNNNGSAGTTLLKIVGSADQTVTGAVGIQFPSTEIASTGGTIFFMGELELTRDFKYTSGTVNMGTANVKFTGLQNMISQINPGPLVFNNVTINTYVANLVLTGDLNVTGDFTTVGYVNYSDKHALDGGNINVYGNVSINANGQGAVEVSGSTTLTFLGTSNATYTVGTQGTPFLGAVTINKTGGSKVTFGSNVKWSEPTQNLIITNGTLDMAGYSLTVGNNITNGGVLRKGASGSCGILTYAGSYAGTAPICP